MQSEPVLEASLRPAAWQTFAAAVLAAVLAVLLRIPPAGESLWVDELHSAWAVWGEWREVAARAAWGNQTPWYFYALWAWRNLLGDSELVLRLPSILATALAAAVLVVGVARNGGGVLGGAIAGVLLAVDRNAIFFGTETRPYAGTILAVAVATWAAAELRRAELLRAVPGNVGWGRGGLLLACFVGFLGHATAAIPLAVLATTLFVWPLRDRRKRSWKSLFEPRPYSLGVFLAVVAVMASVLWINAEVIFRVWSDRAQWNAFGRPRSFRELWTIWPWTWLVLVPVAVWLAAKFLSREGRQSVLSEREEVRVPNSDMPNSDVPNSEVWGSRAELLAPVLAAALLATALGWAVSCWGIAPIWHRRFLIGVLPLLCWAAGGYWGASTMRLSQRLRPLAAVLVTGAVVMVVAVGGLMFEQGTLAELSGGDFSWVRRGEDWRAAVAYLNQHREPHEPAFVAAELLESSALDPPSPARDRSSPREPSRGMVEYLRYPVSGPYRVEGAIPLGRQSDSIRDRIAAEFARRQDAREPFEGWVVLRRREPQARELLAPNRFGSERRGVRLEAIESQAFGGVTVVRIGSAASE